MKRLPGIATVSLAIMLATAGCTSYAPSHGWEALIDGSNGMENWNTTGGANWHAADGSIQADKSTTKGEIGRAHV